jgi:hypothetical protein
MALTRRISHAGRDLGESADPKAVLMRPFVSDRLAVQAIKAQESYLTKAKSNMSYSVLATLISPWAVEVISSNEGPCGNYLRREGG